MLRVGLVFAVSLLVAIPVLMLGPAAARSADVPVFTQKPTPHVAKARLARHAEDSRVFMYVDWQAYDPGGGELVYHVYGDWGDPPRTIGRWTQTVNRVDFIERAPMWDLQFGVEACNAAGQCTEDDSYYFYVDRYPEADTVPAGWELVSSAHAWGGSLLRTTTPGASITFYFHESIGVFGSRGPAYGEYSVYLDGVLVKTLDAQRPSRQHRALLFQKAFAGDAAWDFHSVKIVNEGSPGHPRLDVDGRINVWAD
jgi:hypothetical protein